MTVKIWSMPEEHLKKPGMFKDVEECYFHVKRVHTVLSPTAKESLSVDLTFEDGTELTIPHCTSIVTGDY